MPQTRIVKVQAPDGSIIKVEGPSSATDDQFIAQAKTLWKPAASPNQAILDRQATQFPTTDTERIRAQQAAQFPTSSESGGTPGAMVEPQASPIYRGAAGVGRVVAGIAKMPWEIGKANFTPPQDDAERFASSMPGGLMVKRMITDPAEARAEKAGNSKTTLGVLANSIAAGVPMVGPYAADVVERYQSGDRIGAATEGLTAILAPKAMNKAAGKVLPPKYPDKLKLPTPERPTQLFSDALNGKRSMQFETEIQGNIDTAFPDLKRSEGDFLKGPVKNKREAVAVGENAYKRVYAEEVKPFIEAAPAFDLRPIAAKLKAQIPEWFTEAEVRKATKTIDGIFNKELSGPAAESLRQKLRAENKVNIAKNSYERAAVEKTARGWTLGNMYSEMRTAFADHVQATTGRDIRPALGRYGAVTDIVQELKGAPIDPTILERIEGSYLSGTKPNAIGTATKIAGNKWRSSDALIRRAFAKYDGPRSVSASAPSLANILGPYQKP